MKKDTGEIVILEEGELGLITEALKKQEESVRRERFYSREHPEYFYDMYLERYSRILNKLSFTTKFIKVPKKFWF